MFITEGRGTGGKYFIKGQLFLDRWGFRSGKAAGKKRQRQEKRFDCL